MIDFTTIDFEYQRRQFYNTRSVDTESTQIVQLVHMYIADTCKLNLQTIYNPFSGYEDEKENWEDFICHFNMYEQVNNSEQDITLMDCFTRPPTIAQKLYNTTDYWWYVFQSARCLGTLIDPKNRNAIEEYAERYFENYRRPKLG